MSMEHRYRGVNTDKEFFSTNDVARICDVNIASVKNWIAKKEFPDTEGTAGVFRTPGGHLRVRKSSFVAFLKKYPFAPGAFDPKHKTVFLIADRNKSPKVVDVLKANGYNVVVEDSGYSQILKVPEDERYCVLFDRPTATGCLSDQDTDFIVNEYTRWIPDVPIILYGRPVKAVKDYVTFVPREFRYANLIEALQDLHA